MGEFIAVSIDPGSCSTEGCRGLVGLCPVDIFVESAEGAAVDEGQVDECTLCGLCWEQEPEGVRVSRLYLPDEQAGS